MGIIVPDAESTKEWAKEQGMDDLSFPELCRQPILKCVTSPLTACMPAPPLYYIILY